MTLDDDLTLEIQRLMRERGAGWKDTVNELLRRGLQSTRAVEPYEPPTFRSGVRPGVDLDKATKLVGELEDAELVRKVEMGK